MLAQLLIVVGFKVSAQSISPICEGHAVFFLGCLTLEDGKDGHIKTMVSNYQHCITSQKKKSLNCTAVEASNITEELIINC
jgi:hypothetical protein